MKVVDYTLPPLDFASLLKPILKEGRSVRFRVRGHSMRVFVEHERDEALLTSCKPEELQRGDVVLAKVTHTRIVLHRIIKVEQHQLTLQGDGNVGQVEHCPLEAVVGRVVGFYRKGNSTFVSCKSLKWKTYSCIWLSLTPFRRYLLAAYRHIWTPVFGRL